MSAGPAPAGLPQAGRSPTGPFLIGLDVGTTRVKAVAFDATGTLVADAERPTPWCADARGIAMDATVLTDVVRTVAGEAAAALPDGDGSARVAGLGVTGMGEAGVLTAADGVPLAPIWAWHDQRADVERVRAELGEQAFHRAVGMRLDAQPSLPKILRLRTEYPASVAATRFWSVPEWAVTSLGGTPGSELSLASRTGLLDVATGGPWAGAVSLLGADLLGTPQPAGTVQGALDVPGLPKALQGAVLVVGGHDHQCAALAAGAARDGTLFNSLGTAEALLRFTGPIAPDVIGDLAADHDGTALTVGLTVVAGHYCVMAGLRTGAGLERIAAALGARTREQRARLADAALDIASAAATDPDRLAGVEVEQLPDGVRLTLTRDAGPAQIWCAAVHSLVAASDPSIDRITAAVGKHDRVLAAGGWLHDRCVLAAKSAQLPGLAVTSVAEAGAAGAAWLAGVAAGLFPDRARPVPLWVPTGASSTVSF